PELSAARGTLITLADGTQVAAIFNLPAVIIIAIVTFLLVIGIRESATVNNVIVFVKVAVVLLFIVGAAHAINPANWHPFIPPNTGIRENFGWSGVVSGGGVVFFAYIGFDAVSTAAQEAKNPQRDMPIGIIGSLLICTVLYILVVIVLTGMVKYDQLDEKAAVAQAFEQRDMTWAKALITPAALAGLTSVILVSLLGSTRVLMAMSRDGLLPPFFSTIHSSFKTPWKGTIVVGLIAAPMAGLLPLDALLQLTNIGTLF